MGKKVKKVPTKKAAKSKVATKRATSVSKKKVTPVKAKTKARVQKTASPKTKSIKKKPAKKKPSGPIGYTTTEYEKFKEERNRLSQLSNQALKDILRKNMQSMSGTKDVLIEKVADGIVLGRIPRCPNCFGGRYLSFLK